MANGNCSRCGKLLDGKHKAYCRSCAAEYARENRIARGEKATKYQREYRRQWMADHPEKRVEYTRKALYGLTPEYFDDLWKQQNGCCAICTIPLTQGRGGDKLAVDHDHYTNAVRGLLCQNCNTMLGYAKDDPIVLQRAASYLLARLPQSAEGAPLNRACSGSSPETGTTNDQRATAHENTGRGY